MMQSNVSSENMQSMSMLSCDSNEGKRNKKSLTKHLVKTSLTESRTVLKPKWTNL